MLDDPDPSMRQQRIERSQARMPRQLRKHRATLDILGRPDTPMRQHQTHAHDTGDGPDHQTCQQAEHLPWRPCAHRDIRDALGSISIPTQGLQTAFR